MLEGAARRLEWLRRGTRERTGKGVKEIAWQTGLELSGTPCPLTLGLAGQCGRHVEAGQGAGVKESSDSWGEADKWPQEHCPSHGLPQAD